jgi:hypothetical protein
VTKPTESDALMVQAMIAGYVAASVMQMPLTPPLTLEECEAGKPIKIRLASGMLAWITVEVKLASLGPTDGVAP